MKKYIGKNKGVPVRSYSWNLNIRDCFQLSLTITIHGWYPKMSSIDWNYFDLSVDTLCLLIIALFMVNNKAYYYHYIIFNSLNYEQRSYHEIKLHPLKHIYFATYLINSLQRLLLSLWLISNYLWQAAVLQKLWYEIHCRNYCWSICFHNCAHMCLMSL